MSTVDCPAERLVSARLFGNRHKLELLLALASAEDGAVSLSELADANGGVSPSVYYAPIRDLTSAGLVERVAPVPGERRRWYRRSGHRFWASAATPLAELVAAHDSAGGGS
jgi:hypothetical protein